MESEGTARFKTLLESLIIIAILVSVYWLLGFVILKLFNKEIRTEKGYAMILNSRTQDGSQVILAAEDADDITAAVFEKLGVPMPVQAGDPADSTGTGN